MQKLSSNQIVFLAIFTLACLTSCWRGCKCPPATFVDCEVLGIHSYNSYWDVVLIKTPSGYKDFHHTQPGQLQTGDVVPIKVRRDWPEYARRRDGETIRVDNASRGERCPDCTEDLATSVSKNSHELHDSASVSDGLWDSSGND